MTNEELVTAIRGGNNDLILDLWNQTQRFIGQRASIFYSKLGTTRGITEEDLKQSGFIALMNAVNGYDPGQGCLFLTYLGYHLQNQFAAAAGMRTDRQANDPVNTPISLNAPLRDDEATTLLDTLPGGENGIVDAEKRIYQEQLRDTLEQALNEIRPEDAEALRELYFNGKTLQEAGEATGAGINITQHRKLRGLKALKRSAKRTGLDQFIDFRTPYYARTNFKTSQVSPVEYITLLREQMRERYEGTQTADTSLITE